MNKFARTFKFWKDMIVRDYEAYGLVRQLGPERAIFDIVY